MIDVFAARWVLPVDRPPIENGAVAVEGGHIVGVGPVTDVVRDIGDNQQCEWTMHELGMRILMPGFVNPHTHLEMTCYRGRVPKGPLWEWFNNLMALRLKPEAAEDERLAVGIGAEESLAAGVTCVADISRLGIHIEGLVSSPIRKVCFIELISGVPLPPNDLPSLRAALSRAFRFASPGRLFIGLTPHTLYTVTEEHLPGVVELAREHGLPLTMHLLETTEEQQWLAAGNAPLDAFLARCRLPTAGWSTRLSVGEYMRRSGLLDLQPLFAHVNFVDDETVRVLAKSGASVAWCPRSHAFFGHSAHPWRQMLSAGVNVCVGTDSLASNETLSILDELRFVYRVWPDTVPDLLLEMGTIRAARALGLGESLGTLTCGKKADFVTVPCDVAAVENPVAKLLAGSQTVDHVWIDGSEVGAAGGIGHSE